MKKILTALLFLVSAPAFSQSPYPNGYPISNKASGGSLGNNLINAASFNVNQTTAGQTITVASPNGGNKSIQVNDTGSVSFTLVPGGTIDPGYGALLRWTGRSWSVTGVGKVSGGGGTISAVNAGTWMTGGGSSGSITLDIDTSKVTSIPDLNNGLALKVDKVSGKQLSTEDYSTAEKSKLAGIASGATANDTDANLKNRANHTGTQPYTTITGLGDAANKNTGTTAGTLAAGDDSRFTAINGNTQAAINLKANDANVVHNTGTETIAGVKTFSSSPSIPTSSPGSNNNDAASNAYVDAATGVTTPVGVIINETFSNLTNFTQTGTAFAVSGGVCNITGGSSFVFTDYIRQTQYGKSDLEKFTIEADYTIGTIGANTNGVGFGLKPAGALNSTASITVAFLANTGNSGKIGFYFNAATTGAIISTGKLTLTAGDVTHVKINMLKNTLFVTWTDVTTNQTTNAVYQYHQESLKPVVSSTVTSIIPDAFYYTVYALGGSHSIDNFKVTCDEFKNADYVFVGNSIDKGYNVDDVSQRYVDIINNSTIARAVLIAGQSDCVEDWNAAEILSLQARNIIISVGGNNLILAESTSATMAKLATLVTSLQAGGYVLGSTLWVCTARPRATYDMTSLNASIRSTYSTSFIELFYPYWAGSSFTMNPSFYSTDQTHPNVYGHKMEGLIYVKFFNIKQRPTYNLNNNYLFKDEVGFAGIGFANNTPLYPADVFSDIQTQLRVGTTYSYSSRGGGTLTSTAASHVILMGGADYKSVNGALFTATSTSASGVQCNAGDISFFGNTGLTANTNYTLTGVGIIKSTGRWGVGTVSAPSAWLHLPAGTTTANTAPIKLNIGVDQTTGEVGALNFSLISGSNQLRFVRSGTTYETIMTTPAVNTVSPTLPNRTITVVIDGTTYYISAKTTND
jgi:hypothetical protein